ncbi:MAG: 16S rRNA (guanine(527)-N(7))-methyltransferase RsmG [Bacteroidia bacterium]|nr:16S rRNA (guanine(527)-N(7))-methyltransferase RsmG [Bacteroidia bacterium]MDW8158611.1 16S rRNA (guanine(527)-N(7))-methyltransferase RsmG [Bacteroidia bacterium]
MSKEKIELLKAFCQLLTDWNTKINLISRKDIDNLVAHHLLSSLALLHFANFVAGTTFLDLGTGGGLPGLPLAIILPQCNFVLLDSTQKKINVLNTIIRELNITNTTTLWQRIQEHKEQYDFIVGRAVCSPIDFYHLAKKNIHCKNKNQQPNGIYYWSGGTINTKQFPVPTKIFYLAQQYYNLPFFETKFILYLKCCSNS